MDTTDRPNRARPALRDLLLVAGMVLLWLVLFEALGIRLGACLTGWFIVHERG